VKKISKVLLIDDDPVSNHINSKLLDQVNLAKEIVVKETAKEALLYLQSDCYSSGKYPDLILLDLKMPVLDGFAFLEEFGRLKLNKYNIVIVILSHSVDAEDILRLKNMGRYFLVNKPLTIDKIIDIHHRYFRNSGFWSIFA
jgi:CheY-like chemotaxis protein